MNRKAYETTVKISLCLAGIDAPAFMKSVGGRLFFQSYPSWGERTESRIKERLFFLISWTGHSYYILYRGK